MLGETSVDSELCRGDGSGDKLRIGYSTYGARLPPAESGSPAYYLPPSEMLDWTPTVSKGDYTFLGFNPPEPAPTRDKYTTGTGPVPNYPGAPAA